MAPDNYIIFKQIRLNTHIEFSMSFSTEKLLCIQN